MMRRSLSSPVVRRATPVAALLACAGIVALAPPAKAEAPFIYRGITVPRGDVDLGIGFGVGHDDHDPGPSRTGVGINLELAFGLTHELELGLRTGFRLDDDGQATQADRYGRPFDTETYGTNNGRVANPEIRLRWSVARGSTAQIGLEWRAYLPIEPQSHFGMMFGLPIALHAASIRLDTGIYVPIIFSDPTMTIVSIPLHLWIQASSRLWLGPLFGVRIVSQNGTHNEYPLGFGLGSMLTRSIDLRTWFLFPDINRDEGARQFGAGVALQIRFE
jgi:hypothetical protein